ncbi:MAG: cupin domain-containing protein [Spirochaetes bacterium]|nr:cupin domain-containing protein [Spirochaetota bacterium]
MNMEQIIIEKPDEKRLNELGVKSWPIWEKEVSEFDWYYDSKEICYLLEGKVTVTPQGGESVQFGIGDLVTFPKGMKCVWSISENVRKHYKFV